MIVQKFYSLLSIISITFILFSSCKKEEGEGGKYSIKGKIVAKYYAEWNKVPLAKYTGTSPASDQNVFIVYGDNVGYGDRTFSSYDGAFEFKYLQKGKYKIYLFSKDTTLQSPNYEYPVVIDVDLSGNKDLGEIFIAREDKTDLEIGPYKITGSVSALDCDATFSVCNGPYAGIDIDVYITRSLNEPYFDRTTTYSGGQFQFPNLPEGTYYVYAISNNQLHIFDPSLPKETIVSTQVDVVDMDEDAGVLNIIE
ncbi:MAG: hypothetical protein U0U66_12345 [Cytophagaceae bacterium]